MPQLTGQFGPIPSEVVLDGNGDGYVIFQPNGSPARITTLFVKVSTSVAQAVVTLYKGQIADTNIIGNTNSGSTGAPAFGNIDLFDGETLYVMWRGGDAGATATATFTGNTIPFQDIGSTNLRWDDPIAAGDGSLIFPALKSPNYVAGVSGWYLDRNGNADLNNVSVRGELIVDGTGSSQIRIYDNPGLGQPTIELTPDAVNVRPALILTDATGGVLPFLTITSPAIPSTNAFAQMQLIGEATDPPLIVMQSSDFNADFELDVTGKVIVSNRIEVGGTDGNVNWVNGTTLTVNSGPITGAATETVIITLPEYTHKAGRAYKLEVSGLFNVSVSPNRPVWQIRKTNNVGQSLKTADVGAVNTGQHSVDFACHFTVGGTDVTAELVVTLSSASGTFSVTQLAPTEVNVYEIGAATNKPSSPVLA